MEQPRAQLWRISLTVIALSALPLCASADQPAAKSGDNKHTNRLARETSPYLLQHAHNPVDWYPWGPEAFAKAKKEGKLVFLSIGYSSCYWCHVMERESFENAEVAQLLNDWFVCIKVDREERPDIDTIYMTALQVLRQRGGWPLSMFLTADGKPVVGGTYWPPEDKKLDDGNNVRGFKSVLKLVHDLHATKKKELEDNADRLSAATQDALSRSNRGAALVELNRELVQAAVNALKEEFDKVHGGFGSVERGFRGTKFPTPPYLELLLYEAKRTNSAELAGLVTTTLDHMAEGGIYDQLGGGFHRYSTERTWTVPHFEKMLYDNAQLAEVYAEAYRRTKKPLYRRVLGELLTFVGREMTSPQGGFYSALDAETNGHEGRYYVWTEPELQAALPQPADLALARKVYGAEAAPNFEAKYHILTRRQLLAEVAQESKIAEDQVEPRLESVRGQLFKARSERARPFLDTKILTAWNGEMIAGYVAAGQALDEPSYIATAARAADFLLENLRTKDGRLLRTFGAQPGDKTGVAKLNAYLDDYAYFVHGLLALHDATKDKRWLDEAKALTDTMVKHHLDDKNGGFFYTSNDHEKLFARAKDQFDGAQPSGNSMAADNLVRLWVKTGDEKYRAQAENTFKAFAGSLKLNPSGLTYLACALDRYLDARAAKESKPN